ncbi:hypothetical protein LCGC14_2455530 [marine sediment metagenome]|uniref:Uncharacterized protein n=1 Tax=marine sediment metagenome TaxID=412755 RepID=A0A0F9BER8_9ZZZZ
MWAYRLRTRRAAADHDEGIVAELTVDSVMLPSVEFYQGFLVRTAKRERVDAVVDGRIHFREVAGVEAVEDPDRNEGGEPVSRKDEGIAKDVMLASADDLGAALDKDGLAVVQVDVEPLACGLAS